MCVYQDRFFFNVETKDDWRHCSSLVSSDDRILIAPLSSQVCVCVREWTIVLLLFWYLFTITFPHLFSTICLIEFFLFDWEKKTFVFFERHTRFFFHFKKTSSSLGSSVSSCSSSSRKTTPSNCFRPLVTRCVCWRRRWTRRRRRRKERDRHTHGLWKLMVEKRIRQQQGQLWRVPQLLAALWPQTLTTQGKNLLTFF